MRIGYLVFAYKNPQVLERATSRLSGEHCTFFIHIDQNRKIDDFSQIRGENIYFSPTRIPVHWAEFSGVEAILLLMRQALCHHPRPDYLVLLSGSDYPLRSSAYIHRFFEEHRGEEFISSTKMPNESAGKPISRINTVRFQSDRPISRFVGRALAKVSLAQRDYRRYLGSLEPYSGNTWWALSSDACQFILEFNEQHQFVGKFFRDTFAPEEMFFHTILCNSSFGGRVRRNLLYEDWSASGAHPAMISDRHLSAFEAQDKVCLNDVWGPSEVLFARKFSDDNLDALRRLDEMIVRKEKSQPVKP